MWRYQRGNQKTRKDQQYNGQKKNDKSRDNDLQKATQKTKDWAARTPLTFIVHKVILNLQSVYWYCKVIVTSVVLFLLSIQLFFHCRYRYTTITIVFFIIQIHKHFYSCISFNTIISKACFGMYKATIDLIDIYT